MYEKTVSNDNDMTSKVYAKETFSGTRLNNTSLWRLQRSSDPVLITLQPASQVQ